MTEDGLRAAPGGASRRSWEFLVSPPGIATLYFVIFSAWILGGEQVLRMFVSSDVANVARPGVSIAFAALLSVLLVVLIQRDRRGISGELRARDRLRRRTADLTTIIEDRAFDIVYQPIVEIETGRLVGYEALTRFDDGVPPSDRFADAAELRLGVALEAACLEEAVASASGLPSEAWLSLNASAGLLTSPRLEAILRHESRTVVIELTEHEPVSDYEAVRRALSRMEGCMRLAVDDAGAGYASLRHLAELQPALVKLDRGLVHRVESDPNRQAIIAGLQRYAEGTRTELIAEGVETEAERETLLRIGITLGQGYLFGAPGPLPAGRATVID